jgi:hypothetical protein
VPRSSLQCTRGSSRRPGHYTLRAAWTPPAIAVTATPPHIRTLLILCEGAASRQSPLSPCKLFSPHRHRSTAPRRMTPLLRCVQPPTSATEDHTSFLSRAMPQAVGHHSELPETPRRCPLPPPQVPHCRRPPPATVRSYHHHRELRIDSTLLYDSSSATFDHSSAPSSSFLSGRVALPWRALFR